MISEGESTQMRTPEPEYQEKTRAEIERDERRNK